MGLNHSYTWLIDSLLSYPITVHKSKPKRLSLEVGQRTHKSIPQPDCRLRSVIRYAPAFLPGDVGIPVSNLR